MTTTATIKQGNVTGIISNLVLAVCDAPVAQNEICYIRIGEEQLLGEIIKVIGNDIFIQCFENTRGMKVGNTIQFNDEMLDVT